MGMRAGRSREQARAFSLRVVSGGGGADPHNCPASKKKRGKPREYGLGLVLAGSI